MSTCTCNSIDTANVKEFKFSKTIEITLAEENVETSTTRQNPRPTVVKLSAEQTIWRAFDSPRWSVNEIGCKIDGARAICNNVLADELRDMGLCNKAEQVRDIGNEKYGVTRRN